MADKLPTASQIYTKGIENLKQKGVNWEYPTPGRSGTSLRATRKVLDSMFFEPKFFDPVPVDTSLTLFGVKLKTPIFCSAISRRTYMPESSIAEIAKGIAEAGAFMMVGIGGSDELQGAIDSGAPVVKMVKPYANTELIYQKVRDAESRGCAAVGMDIDHFYGRLGTDCDISLNDLFAPQSTQELKQVFSQTKLPVILKGVLSAVDAEKAIQLGATVIMASNHGSFSLESSVPSIVALTNLVDMFGYKTDIFVDSCFESGNDALKAMALGARAVGMGHPVILAWAADGANGVKTLINQCTEELRRTMGACGCGDLASVNRSIIVNIKNI